VKSEGFQRIKSPDRRGESWSSGLVDVGPVGLQAKGTLLESPGGGGGALVSVPYVVPGIVDKLFQPLTVENLLLSGQTPSPSVRYITQGTATSGAAGVAEGGVKPESTIGMVTADEPIKKIATVTVCSDEIWKMRRRSRSS
jgi:hypothetical protein